MSRPEIALHKNLIEYLEIRGPKHVWVADITFIGNKENPMYLTLITDAYSKNIKGCYQSSLKTKACIKALEMPIRNRKYLNGELYI